MLGLVPGIWYLINGSLNKNKIDHSFLHSAKFSE